MLTWSQRGPVRRVAEALIAGDPVQSETLELALDIIRQIRRAACQPGASYTAVQKAEITRVQRRLDALASTLAYGELPDYPEFVTHLRYRDLLQRGQSRLLDFQLTAVGPAAAVAEEALDLTDRPRSAVITRASDGSVSLTLRNARTLYNYLGAVSRIRGGAARTLGKTLMASIGYTWV